jgi:WD40 repeat protein
VYRCSKCNQFWDDDRARDNDLTCTRRCDGRLVSVEPPALPDLEEYDLARLPYPVALTTRRLAAAVQASGDALKTLFLLKDCFEATIKYFGALLLSDYRRTPACTPEHNARLLEKMIRPSLGVWVETVVGNLGRWLVGGEPPGGAAAALFMTAHGKPRETELFARCRAFVDYRNDALGHGAVRSDRAYADDLRTWLPRLRGLLDGVASLSGWRLCLPTDRDRCQAWMGPRPGGATEPGDFARGQVGRFVLRGPGGAARDLYPFLCYLPDPRQERRLHFYDSLARYTAARKEVEVLEYDQGLRQASAEPVAGLEGAFTADLLAKVFGRHRERMAVIEGRVANFGELIDAHAAIVGRRFAIDHVRRFLAEYDRGLLVIEAQPGKGKTALMAHLIEEVFGHYAPRPVHFFYRRTAGITDPDVCARSLYHALLEAHGITEAEESKQKNSPDEVSIKLTNLLGREVAPRLLPGRPQLIFIDALDEATGNAFRRIPEGLPAGVYVIAATRPVSDRTTLARRQDLHWYSLDAPDLLQENLRDGLEYARRELAGSDFTDGVIGEVARAAAGNFLVLTLLCRHLRAPAPGEVAAFLGRLAAEGGEDRLGFIYAEFWDRLTDRCTREDMGLLCDVAGVLVTARAPLTADIICGVLGLRAGDWDFALRRLAEYLTVIEGEEGTGAAFYRLYHESFADFLRAKVAPGREHVRRRLADYCLGWSSLPEGPGRTYALQFGPAHLLEAGRGEEAASLLLHLSFLEAKAGAGMVFELAADFAATAARLGEGHRRRWLGLIEEALRRDIHFIARRPAALFQCLWNSCWWYDCPQGADYYDPEEGSWPPAEPPWEQEGPKLSDLLLGWRAGKESAQPGFTWVRSMRPPASPLGTSLRKVLIGHEDGVVSLAFAPDGRRLASASGDGTVRVWDVATGEHLGRWDHGGIATAVAFSPDGRRLVYGVSDGSVRLRDAASGDELACLRGHEQGVYGVACSPDGRWVASAGPDAVVVWDVRAGRPAARLAGHSASRVAFSPDGRWVVTGSPECRFGEDYGILFSEPGGGAQQVRLYGHPSYVEALAFSPDGRYLAAASGGSLHVWDVAGGDEVACLQADERQVTAVAWSPDGRLVITGCYDGKVRVWGAAGWLQVGSLRGHTGAVGGLACSPDGRWVASAGLRDCAIRIWDLAEAAEEARPTGHEGAILCLEWAPDGRRVATGGADGTLRIWDGAGGRQLACLRGHGAAVVGLSWSPDGRRILSVGGRAARVWDAESRREVSAWQIPDGRDVLRAVCRSPGGWRCVSSPEDRVTYHFTPDGLRRDPDTPEARARVWDPESGREVVLLRGYRSIVSGLAFSPDGRRLVTAGGEYDRTARVWDAATGEQLLCLEGHGGKVLAVAFSRDGRRVVSKAHDKTMRVWDAATGDCLEVVNAWGDPTALADVGDRSQGIALRGGLETWVEPPGCGAPVAWSSALPNLLATRPDGISWAGATGAHLHLFTLEASGTPTPTNS